MTPESAPALRRAVQQEKVTQGIIGKIEKVVFPNPGEIEVLWLRGHCYTKRKDGQWEINPKLQREISEHLNLPKNR